MRRQINDRRELDASLTLRRERDSTTRREEESKAEFVARRTVESLVRKQTEQVNVGANIANQKKITETPMWESKATGGMVSSLQQMVKDMVPISMQKMISQVGLDTLGPALSLGYLHYSLTVQMKG